MSIHQANQPLGSYYDSSSCPYPDLKPLNTDLDIDVAVVGGGITGLSCAIQLADLGISSAVFEEHQFAYGASGRSGGQILIGYNESTDRLTQLFGAQQADALWQLSLDAVALTRQYIARFDIQCDLKSGALILARPVKQDRLQLDQYQRNFDVRGIGCQRLSGEALKGAIDSPYYSQGLLEQTSGHLHPKNYTLGLAKAALGLGVSLYDHSPVTHLDRAQGIRLQAGPYRIKAQRLVLAGNAYINNLLPGLSRPLLPVSSHIIATQPLASPLIGSQAACSDLAFLLHYFRMSADGRLLFGGRPGILAQSDLASQDILRKRMVRIFPQLERTPIDFSWGGKVAITQPQLPYLRQLDDQTWVAQGYSGHGMALAGLAGRILAASIAGQDDNLRLFSQVPHWRFPTSASARSGLAQLGMLWYQLRETLSEALDR